MFKINEFEINNLEDFKKVIEQDPLIIKKFKHERIITKTKILTYNIYMYLCMYGTLDMLKYLEQYLFFANIKEFKDEDSNDLYIIAVIFGQLEIMKYLEKEHNWNIYVKNNYGNYPYLCASINGHLEIMKHLEKEHHPNIYVKSNYGNLEMTEHLKKIHNKNIHVKTNYWNIHVKNNDGNDVYLVASIYGKLEIMKYLEKEHNWDINVKDKYGNDAYLLASLNGHLEIMKHLEKEHNWDIKSLKKYCKNDIYYRALEQEKIEVIKYLDEIHDWSFHDYGINIKNEEILKYLTIKKIKRNTKRIKKCSSDECCICLINFNKDDWVNKCINGHNYHEDCLSESVWKSYLDNKIKCCICKDDMIKDCLFQYE